MLRCEIILKLNSRKICSQPITFNKYHECMFCAIYQLCFFYSLEGNERFCCSENQDDGMKVDLTPQPPKFKQDNGKAYECNDHTSHCERWAKDFPDSCTNSSHKSFEFMRFSCMKSCDLCGKEVNIDIEL